MFALNLVLVVLDSNALLAQWLRHPYALKRRLQLKIFRRERPIFFQRRLLQKGERGVLFTRAGVGKRSAVSQRSVQVVDIDLLDQGLGLELSNNLIQFLLYEILIAEVVTRCAALQQIIPNFFRACVPRSMGTHI